MGTYETNPFNMTRILLVCLGNICRSPMAHGILREKAKERGVDLKIESAGTGDYHIGEAPDPRAQEQLKKEGIDISDLRARQFEKEDFERFDRIFVMDEENLNEVRNQARSPEEENKVDVFLNTVEPGSDMPVPDPYFGGEKGFTKVHELLEKACETLLNEIEPRKA